MENSDSDEPEKKRRHLNSVSPTMARSSSTSPPKNHSVDAAALQLQNQQLNQQVHKQKLDLQDLEAKIQELKDKQGSYDDFLITMNQLWNQLVDDLILLGLCAGGAQNALEILDGADYSCGSIPSCSAEEMFLFRLLQQDSLEANVNDEIVKYVEETLALRHTSTMDLLELLEHAIYAHREKTMNISHTLDGKISSEDAIIRFSKIDDMMEGEVKKLREGIDFLHLKHKEYTDVIRTYISSHSRYQSEIRRITGELDDKMADLELKRRKLINLKMQKDVGPGVQNRTSSALNGTLSPEKSTERTISLQELRNSIEETRILEADRLSEYQDAHEENLVLSKQLQEFQISNFKFNYMLSQDEVKDDKYVLSSRLYSMLNDQLQHWNTELDRYKALTDSLQADRTLVVRREKDLNVKLELADAIRNPIDNSDSRIEELELQLQKCIIAKNDFEINMEEAVQDSGRKDIIAEFRVMASSLCKEMGMVETQLKRWKETAHETLCLCDKAQSLKASSSTKTNEQKILVDKCGEQVIEIKSLKALIEKLQKEKLKLKLFRECYVGAIDLMEIKESERRAYSQAEMLKNALDEHSLELRVKAANEAEAACQQRLSATEAEITELSAKLDALERDVMELTEAIGIKDKEAEAYISEIETIGQAYEICRCKISIFYWCGGMVAHCPWFLNGFFGAGIGEATSTSTSLESLKIRVSHGEEQMKALLTDAIKTTEEDRQLAVNVETVKWELADSEELQWLKSAFASSEKEHVHIEKDIDDVRLELENERSSRKNLEEELGELNSIIAEMSSETGEAAIQKLQTEIKFCENILQCSVCTDRPNEILNNPTAAPPKSPFLGLGFEPITNPLKSSHSYTNPRNPKLRIHASLLEAPVLWAGRLCIFYALLKTGLAGSPASPLLSDLGRVEGEEGDGVVSGSVDLGFSKWLNSIQGKPAKEAADKRKLVSKWHPTTKGTLRRNYRVPSKSEGRRLLKGIASLLSDDDHFVDATSHKFFLSQILNSGDQKAI
ncbi:E3 ubiquitin-protein ligase BRE1-like 2 [Pyrus ussuriensis x Pyrus communis]|uniref:E3 ubiquitin protein ligase n=1 Tax=Pyrus ussuriensis x Pyrus communis TaxID=2448454 RepID=A0A5N5HLN4_9ROSA|nr:E3 ubiquitin-protein ligase BRE1-like 2 [Pyrus ussuriensis x Pyrus communis]